MAADADVRTLRKNRALLRNLPHFQKYRGRKFDLYHAAARADALGCASSDQKRRIAGLDLEISASKNVLQPGQVVMHGRCDNDLVTKQPYPTYVSTTLNAVVDCNSAFRRAGVGQVNGRPLVFVLTLRVPLPALWGQVGRSAEWELLLPRNVAWRETGRTNGIHFDIVEAEVV